MKDKILLAVALLFFLSDFNAQSNFKNTFEFSSGFNIGALKNLEIAPVSKYKYEGVVYKFGYQRNTKEDNLFTIQFDYLNVKLLSEVIPALNLDYAKTGMQVSYLKKIHNHNKSSIHLGLESFSNISTYKSFHASNQVLNQSFGVQSQFSYQFTTKHFLYSKVSVPLLLFRVTHGKSGVYSLKEYQGVLWNFNYNYVLNDNWQFKASYDFNYDRLRIPTAFREVQYQLSFGVNYKF